MGYNKTRHTGSSTPNVYGRKNNASAEAGNISMHTQKTHTYKTGIQSIDLTQLRPKTNGTHHCKQTTPLAAWTAASESTLWGPREDNTRCHSNSSRDSSVCWNNEQRYTHPILGFKAAFDKISHTYLFQILKPYGVNEAFQNRIKSMYERATASVQINGNVSRPIRIKCALRQGCPLSMQLYALCLNPLLPSTRNSMGSG